MPFVINLYVAFGTATVRLLQNAGVGQIQIVQRRHTSIKMRNLHVIALFSLVMAARSGQPGPEPACDCAEAVARLDEKYQTMFATVLSRLAALEHGASPDGDSSNESSSISQRRGLLVAGGSIPRTQIDSRKVKTHAVTTTSINITGNLYLSGTFFWHDEPVGFAVPSIVPSPVPSPSPTPDPSAFFEADSYYGGGWTFVNVASRSKRDTDDLEIVVPGTYALLSYVITTPFNEVLVERVSAEWCSSWLSSSAHWVGAAVGSGSAMGVRADDAYFYYYNNQAAHLWARQPVSFMVDGCKNMGCACYDPTNPATMIDADTRGTTISELEPDGSVVRIHFPETKTQLAIGDFDSIIGVAQCGFGGCNANANVAYRVFTRSTL